MSATKRSPVPPSTHGTGASDMTLEPTKPRNDKPAPKPAQASRPARKRRPPFVL